MLSFGFKCQVTSINYNSCVFAFLGSHHHLMTEDISTMELQGEGGDICFLIIITKLSDQYFLTSWGKKAARHSNCRGDQHLCPPSQPRGMDRSIWKGNQHQSCFSLVLSCNMRTGKTRAPKCSDLHDVSQHL